MRASSDYDRETGYSPFFHAFLADIPRLTSGNSCTLLLMAVWAKSAGRGAAKGKPRPEWTLALSVEDLAQICRCDVRTIERELVALEKRGLGEVRRQGSRVEGGKEFEAVGKGEVSVRLLYRDWERLPDYKSQVEEMPGPDETVEPEQVDETKPGNQRVTGKKPVRLSAGALSKVFPVSCGVKAFRYRVEGPLDHEISCVIQAGELLVVSRLPDGWQQKAGFPETRGSVSKELDAAPRHGRRGEVAKVNHPRAGELCELFEPFLANSGAVLLRMDTGALTKACEAVGDCDHDYLVKFAVNRGAAPIKKPGHVALICAEALQSWRASKVPAKAGAKSDPAGRKPGFADRLRAEAARRLQKYGKV